MKQLQLRILEVENGYVVFEDDTSRHYEACKKWVAPDITRLTALVGELAIDANKPEKGCPAREALKTPREEK